MIRIVIVDDEKASREALASLLSEYTDVEVLSSFSDPNVALKQIQSLKPDLLFLDVEMPEMTGLELLNRLENISFNVIFTTAYEKYAIQAIKASALDYLLKPIANVELKESLEKYRKHKLSGIINHQVEVLLQNYSSKNNSPRSLALPTMQGMEFINTAEIIRLQSDNNYSVFYLDGKRKITVSRTLKDYEEVLIPNGFFRIHQSHIINLTHMKKYTRGDGGYVTMSDGSQVDVSRLRKEDFLETVKEAK